MKYALISGSPPEEYEEFLLECMENLRDYKVSGLAVVAMLEDPGLNALTGYWHMGSVRLSYAAAHVQADAVDQMILDNIERYREYEPEEEDLC